MRSKINTQIDFGFGLKGKRREVSSPVKDPTKTWQRTNEARPKLNTKRTAAALVAELLDESEREPREHDGANGRKGRP